MERIYINSDEAEITRKGTYTVHVKFFSGQEFDNVEVRSLFPVTSPHRYISLLDEDMKEFAVIRNADALMKESRAVILDVLKEYYLIPKITRILDREEKYGTLKWTVDTDHGVRSFSINHRLSDIKTIYDRRVLIRDSNDNRYEIPDYEALDMKSYKKIAMDL